MPFKWVYNLFGARDPTVIWVGKLHTTTGSDVSEGEILKYIASGAVGIAGSAAAGYNLIGAATGDQLESSGSYVYCVANPDAVYEITDAVARYVGDTLDILTGGSAIAESPGSTLGCLRVVETSTSDNPTRVVITPDRHYATAPAINSPSGSRIT